MTNQISQEQIDAWIEALNANPDADLDGSRLRINAELAPFGKAMWWDGEEQTYCVGPVEDD